VLKAKLAIATGNQTAFHIVDPQCPLTIHKEIMDFYRFEFRRVARLKIGEVDTIKPRQAAVQGANPKITIGSLSNAGNDSLWQAGISVSYLDHKIIVQGGRQWFSPCIANPQYRVRDQDKTNSY